MSPRKPSPSMANSPTRSRTPADFYAPYRGRNSLTPNTGAETVDATLFIGARLWPGSEIWAGPEIDQGFGLDDTLGVAGFPSGEAYKVGKNQPYLQAAKAFLRQTIDLDARREPVDSAQLQLGGARSPDRLVLTAGKIERRRHLRQQPVCARFEERFSELGRHRCRHFRLCGGLLGLFGGSGARMVPAGPSRCDSVCSISRMCRTVRISTRVS